MTCQQCGAAMPADDRFCEECGAPMGTIAPDGSGCPKCGGAVEDGYCQVCGFRPVENSPDHFEESPSPSLAAVTDRGRVHYRNEDAFAIHEADGAKIIVVCDGVSSSKDPALASRAAAQTACERLAAGEPIEGAFTAAQEAVTALAAQSNSGKDVSPSTTMVAAIVRGDAATIGWIGDSRAYWLDADGLRQLTQDHSWMYEMVSAGILTEAAASRSPMAHTITRWIGADAGENGGPAFATASLRNGHLVLCSDGLWNYAQDLTNMETQLRHALDGAADSVTVARRLVDFAREQGGHDNITVAVLAVE